ncbi:MAG: TolC family protein [Hydrogenimonas sp.]|nr:TolC family protein [Hydrogenimonas sp.]
MRARSLLLLFAPVLYCSTLGALTLDEAISTALHKSPALKIIERKGEDAHFNRKAKKGAALGKVELVGSYTSYNLPRTLAPIVPPITPGIVSSKNISSVGAKYEVSVFSGFADLRSIEIASIGTKIAESDYALGKEELLYNVKSLFFKILSLKDMQNSTKLYLKALKKLRDDVAKESELGKKAPVDLLKVESDLQEAVYNLKSLKEAVKSLKAKLASLMGVETIDDPVESGFEPVEMDDLSDIKRNYLYKRASLEVAKSAKGVQKAKALYYPKVLLNAYYGKNYGSGESEELWQTGLNLAFPIFDFGVRSAQKQRAEIANQIAKLKLENTLLQLQSDIAKAKGDISSAEAKVSAQRKRVELLEKIKIAERVKYEKGASDIYDLLYAEAKLMSAKSSLSEAIYDLRVKREYLKYILAGER